MTIDRHKIVQVSLLLVTIAVILISQDVSKKENCDFLYYLSEEMDDRLKVHRTIGELLSDFGLQAAEIRADSADAHRENGDFAAAKLDEQASREYGRISREALGVLKIINDIPGPDDCG